MHLNSSSWKINTYDTVPSTQTVAMEMAKAGYSKQVIFTQNQTNGRGRNDIRSGKNRSWHSASGDLTVSFTVRTKEQANIMHLSFVTGLALKRTVEKFLDRIPHQAELFFAQPHNLHLHVKGQPPGKIGGILVDNVESNSDMAVIGVGLNIPNSPRQTNSNKIFQPASLSDCFTNKTDPDLPTPYQVMTFLLQEFDHILHIYETLGFNAVLREMDLPQTGELMMAFNINNGLSELKGTLNRMDVREKAGLHTCKIETKNEGLKEYNLSNIIFLQPNNYNKLSEFLNQLP